MKTRVSCIFALLAAASLISPHGVAIGLGEINIQSSLGEPLRATIPLQSATNEDIDLACLQLSPPPPQEGMVYLRRARLSLTGQKSAPKLLIAGTHALNEPYLIVVIQSGCQEQGRLLREYTVLLDPPTYDTKSLGEPEALPSGDDVSWRAEQEKFVAPSHQAADHPAQTMAKNTIRKKTGNAPSASGQDRLKVISGAGETPAKAEQSEKERLQQREKELMKELDDKTAQFLAMQSQLEKLEARLAEMQKTIALQNKIMTSLQQTAAPAQKPAFRWNDYWLAGAAILIAGMGYLIARRTRQRSLENWQPARPAPRK